jgi:hypothetical protein
MFLRGLQKAGVVDATVFLQFVQLLCDFIQLGEGILEDLLALLFGRLLAVG